ncbi:PRPF4B [Symbiodinium natans]|uniref:PRPF4B protein n=1 Tax=Symbiodinium natans TaxID=878477 RepID=A0A812M7V0_9DINO|nr:PRPF4B [Symbiodinium natans]
MDEDVVRWFAEQVAGPGEEDDAEYSTGHWPLWYVPENCTGAFRAGSPARRQELYQHIVNMCRLGDPCTMMVLARQAVPLYSLFFDLDIFGGENDCYGDESVHDAIWEFGDMLLLRGMAHALLKIYPQLSGGLEVAAFHSSGMSREKQRFKASYHVTFPDIIVDRLVMCKEKQLPGEPGANPSAHMICRDQVLCYFAKRQDDTFGLRDDRIAELKKRLDDLCDHEAVGEGDEASGRNDWQEVFDENALWHDPRPGRRTGFRLPFTDKVVDEVSNPIFEGRPKLPLGRWIVRGSGEEALEDLVVEPLPQLTDTEWVQLGDISYCKAAEPTHLRKDLVDEQVDLSWDGDCPCLVCNGLR